MLRKIWTVFTLVVVTSTALGAQTLGQQAALSDQRFIDVIDRMTPTPSSATPLPALGCSGVVDEDELVSGHTIESTDGTGIDRTTKQFQELSSALSAYLDAHTSPSDVPKIVLHVHGGLVDRCDAYRDMNSLVGRTYDKAGAFALFPVYHTSAVESLDKGWSGRSALDARRGGDPRTMPWMTRFLYPQGLNDDDIVDTRSLSMSRRAELTGARETQRYTALRDHGIGPTSFEQNARYGFIPGWSEGYGTGGRMWSYMKWTLDRAHLIDGGVMYLPHDQWPSEADFQSSDPPPLVRDAVGLKIVRLINRIHRERRDARFLLVGHSTGSIYISKFLRAYHRAFPSDDLRFEVIFFAPAVRYDDWAKVQIYAKDTIKPGNFRIFTMRDSVEKNNFEGPIPGIRKRIYPLSLLYAISGIFEDSEDVPLLGMARFWCPPFRFAPGTSPGASPTPAGWPERDRGRYLTWPKVESTDNTGASTLTDLQVVASVQEWITQLGGGFPFALSPAGKVVPPEGYRTNFDQHGGYAHDVHDALKSLSYLVKNENWHQDPHPPNAECDQAVDKKVLQHSQAIRGITAPRVDPVPRASP